MSCQYIKMLSNCALDDTATYAQLKFHYSYWLYIQRKNVLNNIKQIFIQINILIRINILFKILGAAPRIGVAKLNTYV